MKSKTFSFTHRNLLVLLPLLALVLGGCKSPQIEDPSGGQTADPTGGHGIAILHVGDTVTITLSGPPDEQFAPMDKPIKEDGTITLDQIGRVKAAGKTPGELEDTIHDLYVPKIYTHLSVTVKTSSDRVYYVQGEVKSPGRLLYSGTITVTKAITSAGDFTDFAKHSDITLIRANGKRYKLDYDAILSGKNPDPAVYPSDQIIVGRRIF